MDRPVRRPRLINRRRQGDLGELSAMSWLAAKGAIVWIPFGHSPDADLLAQLGAKLIRIQVKTSTMRKQLSGAQERWEVQIATNGGNQSWSGVAKRFDPRSVDYVFALVGDGRRWFLPADTLQGQTAIALGGPRYSEFEIERGDPILHLVYGDEGGASNIDNGRGSADVGESGETVNLVAQPEWVRIPPPPSTVSSPSGVRPNNAPTRISANHQITIPTTPFSAAGFSVGDRVLVEPTADGEVRVRRIESADQLELLRRS